MYAVSAGIELTSESLKLYPDPFQYHRLVTLERKQWARILLGFERGEYAPKSHQLLPSLVNVLTGSRRDLTTKPLALDAGCGTGFLGKPLARQGWRTYGIDILTSCTRVATKAFPATTGDLHSIPFRSKQFDLVVCSMVLMLVEDPRIAVKELRRVSAPGARVAVSLLNPYHRLVPNSIHSGDITTWRFSLQDEDVDIHYYWRTIHDYRRIFEEVFQEYRSYEVGENGSLREFHLPQEPHPVTEFIWIISDCVR